MTSSSIFFLSPLSVAAQGSAYLLTHRSWTSRIGTGFRKWSFSRPRRFVTTNPASSSWFRCFITPKRVIRNRPSSALNVCPSSLKRASSRRRRVGSASALNTLSTARTICDRMVTCQIRDPSVAVLDGELLRQEIDDPSVRVLRVCALGEAVAFIRIHDVVHAATERTKSLDDLVRFFLRHARVVLALEDEHRTAHVVDVRDRRALD